MIKVIIQLLFISFIFFQCTPAPRYHSRDYSAPERKQESSTTSEDGDNIKSEKNTPIQQDKDNKNPPLLNAGGSNKAVFTASYYGKKFHGQQTSNGETFDMYSYSAAHKKLPFGTILKVTYPKTDKSVLVKINDRGPFVKNRDLDLSYGAAKRIGLARDGVGKVKVEIIKFGN